MVDGAVGEGAKAVTGGEVRTDVEGCEGGTFVEPTILTEVQRGHRVAREEVFGPVLSVIEVDDVDEAVAVVNEVEYGLSAAVYTRDLNRALRAVHPTHTGITHVQPPPPPPPNPPPFNT